MSQSELNLNGHDYQALFTVDGVKALDLDFQSHLSSEAPELLDHLLHYRKEPGFFTAKELSLFLIDLAVYVESFLIELFGIEEAFSLHQERVRADDPIFQFKKTFVLKGAKRRLKSDLSHLSFEILDTWLDQALSEYANLRGDHKAEHQDRELLVAQLATSYLEDQAGKADEIEQLTLWCVLAMTTATGRAVTQGWVSFHLPKRLDYANLVGLEADEKDALGRHQGKVEAFRHRDGFVLTDERLSSRAVMDEVHYCVYCHKNDGDFCSTGFPVKKNEPALGLKTSPLQEVLTGCPLEEKISEMHWLKRATHAIGALVMVMRDNPMCPATGHRICNDCMKSCIYQKQTPVNIPEVETRVLTDVLYLPWGVEIYDLLTRWNPLRAEQYLPKPYNGKKILVMGMGPAGFTAAHHLTMEGCAVVGVDGLKIEPLEPGLLSKPIRDYQAITQSLDDRVMSGFGGVAEYGITVRWDKNFLTLIYLTLARRELFQVFGGVRFGGTLSIDDVWRLGFDHMSLAVGAGLPRELRIPGSLAPGMRQANDFLMALQLTGAAKRDSLANLQVSLPALVIGGGLTGIDTATEVQAYYITQVEKTLARYESLVERHGESDVISHFEGVAAKTLLVFLEHGRAVRAERQRARRAGCHPDLLGLVRSWGGVTIVYRRSLEESPAYRRNHEEVEKALEEGIYYAPGLTPERVLLNDDGWVSGLECRARVMDEHGHWVDTDQHQVLPAASIFVATGAQPNIAYAFEHQGELKRNGWNYEPYVDQAGKLQPADTKSHVKEDDYGVFTSYERDHYRVSFLGDTHPVFHGSVVKAIASATRSYPDIIRRVLNDVPNDHQHPTEVLEKFQQRIAQQLSYRLVSRKRLNDHTIEIEVSAPLVAKHHRPGQFYRVQNFESQSKRINGSLLQAEALSLIGIPSDRDPSCLRFIIFERGASAKLVQTFEVGAPIALMGPTGAKAKVNADGGDHTLVIGGEMAIPYVLAMSPALRESGNHISFMGFFESEAEMVCADEIRRKLDGWVIAPKEEGLSAGIARGFMENTHWQSINHVITIGNADVIRAVQAIKPMLLTKLSKDPVDVRFEASVYGPMQCMLKGVCAQCLQWQIDPKTGERIKAVYACSWQHQPMEKIDTHSLDERLGQNVTQEILTDLWCDDLLESL